MDHRQEPASQGSSSRPIPVLRWDDPDLPRLSGAERDGLLGQVIGAGYGIVRGKGYTSYAIALEAARIIEAVLYDQHQVLPVSSLLTGYAGISDVCLSVPSVVNRAGVRRMLPVPLSGEELDGLRHSARMVRVVLDKLGL